MSNPQNPHQPGHPQNQPGHPQNPGPQQAPGQPPNHGGQPFQPQYASPYPNAQTGSAPGPTGSGAPQFQPAGYQAAGSAPGYPGGGQMPPGGQGMPYGQKPPKQKKPLYKRWWFWLIIVIVVIGLINAIGGGGGDTEDTGSTNSQGGEAGTAEEKKPEDKAAEDKDSAQKPAEEKKEAPAEYGMGDAVNADGWEITVNKVEDGVSTVGNEYLNTKAQGQFVKVSLSVKNTKNSPELFFEDNIKLGDDKGNTYSSDSEAGLYADEDSILFLEEINPGNTAEGVLVFDVPKDVSPDRLTFEGGIFSDPVEISLK
ncbi:MULTISPECIES: DUF4352 domain-containing protein [Brevibacterium]|uniref:DUF4352 domain-containing protein n=1 Tax=Brevibacterium metallidurans TaxID=1482676 RepID=A0ABN0SPR2_9MICO